MSWLWDLRKFMWVYVDVVEEAERIAFEAWLRLIIEERRDK